MLAFLLTHYTILKILIHDSVMVSFFFGLGGDWVTNRKDYMKC